MFDTCDPSDLPDNLSADEVLRRSREVQYRARMDDVELLDLAYAWAVQHPADLLSTDPFRPDAASFLAHDGHEAPISGVGTPGVTEQACAEFGANLALSTTQAKRLIGHAIELRHRLPRIWQVLQTGTVDVFRAQTVAEATIHAFPDATSRKAADWVDRQLAPLLGKVSPARVKRVIDEALLRFGLEDDEEPRDQTRVVLDLGQIQRGGTVLLQAELDLADARDLEHALQRGAAHLKTLGSTASLDSRRASALGELARHQMSSLLDATDLPPARRLDLKLHVRADQLDAMASTLTVQRVGHLEGSRQPVLTDWIRRWAQQSFTEVRILPVLDLNEARSCTSYTPAPLLERQVKERDGTCVFPWCERPADLTDQDHIDPFDPDRPPSDQTTSNNLACLCRRHHRLKTFSGWRYLMLAPGTFRWTSPHGLQYLRHPDGTTVRIDAHAA